MPDQDPWSDEELRASVEAYIEMLAHSRAGREYIRVSLTYSSVGSTNVFSVTSCLQVGHRAGPVKM
jgi:hypothetical protein